MYQVLISISNGNIKNIPAGVIPFDLNPHSEHGIAFEITHSLTTGSPSLSTNFTQENEHGHLTIKTTPATSPPEHTTHTTLTTPTYTEEITHSTSSLTSFAPTTTQTSTPVPTTYSLSTTSLMTTTIGENAITDVEWKCDFEINSNKG